LLLTELIQREFFDQVAAELGIKEFTGWYTVKVRDIRAKGGGALLRRYYGDSLVKALLSLYPNHPWQVWKFEYGMQCIMIGVDAVTSVQGILA
jgi:hypothetical protein